MGFGGINSHIILEVPFLIISKIREDIRNSGSTTNIRYQQHLW